MTATNKQVMARVNCKHLQGCRRFWRPEWDKDGRMTPYHTAVWLADCALFGDEEEIGLACGNKKCCRDYEPKEEGGAE